MHVYFADVPCARVAVTLNRKAVGSARVVGPQSGQRCRGYDWIACNAHTRCEREYEHCAQILETHLSSGAEYRGLACCIQPVREGGSKPVDSSELAMTFWDRCELSSSGAMLRRSPLVRNCCDWPTVRLRNCHWPNGRCRWNEGTICCPVLSSPAPRGPNT